MSINKIAVSVYEQLALVLRVLHIFCNEYSLLKKKPLQIQKDLRSHLDTLSFHFWVSFGDFPKFLEWYVYCSSISSPNPFLRPNPGGRRAIEIRSNLLEKQTQSPCCEIHPGSLYSLFVCLFLHVLYEYADVHACSQVCGCIYTQVCVPAMCVHVEAMLPHFIYQGRGSHLNPESADLAKLARKLASGLPSLPLLY